MAAPSRALGMPPISISLPIAVALVLTWAVLRLGIFGYLLFPLTYALPLLLGVWTRDKRLLWGMAAAFVALHTVQQFALLPAGALAARANVPTYVATLLNIVVGAIAVHIIIAARDRLDGSLRLSDDLREELERQNEGLSQQSEELAQQSEELAQQSEELAQQNEELSQQNEELQAQAEEINGLNQELGRREALLQTLLDSARLAGDERAALRDVCNAALEIFGSTAAAVVVYEKQDDRLVIRTAAGLEHDVPDSLPAAHRFTELVIEQNRTASLSDVSLRPDLTILAIPDRPPFQSVLAAPMRSHALAFGALVVYSGQRAQWSAEQFRLAEWLAGQCAHILEILRLQAGLRRQAALIDLTPDAIIVRRLDGTITLWAHGAEQLYGWTTAEAVGRTTHALLQTRFPEPIEQMNRTLEETGRWSGEVTHTAKDGREVIVQSRWQAERDAAGRVVELLESNVDVTEHARIERALQQSEEQLRVAALAAEIGVWSWTPGTSQVIVSANWRRLFGVAPDAEVTFETWAGALHPDDRDRAVRELNDASREHRELDTEYRVVRPDGSIAWLVDRGRASYDEAGRAIGMAGINIDVTERKRALEALRESDRRKSEFLATLSHELRNPLAPIRYALELLRCEDDDGSPGHPKRVIERQLGHMVRLVDDLLDVTRVASNKIRLRIRRIDLADVVQQAVEATAQDIEQAQHSLVVSLPPEPLWLDADPDRLAQILTNLLNNAARYTPLGGRLALTAATLRNEVVISVSDTGVGLKPEDRDRVFEMFTQVGEPGGGGLGIGLALVKGLVELHGGRIEAKSDGPGCGSQFVIRLPRTDAAAHPAAGAVTARPRGIERRVLVVDDNVDSAEMLKTFLEIHGHEVRVAHDAPSALGLLGEFLPDIGLFDIGLPGMSGYDLARQIRSNGRHDGMFLVAVTGWGQDEDRQRARDSGFNAHLTKPADPADLHRVIAQAGNGGEDHI